MSSQSPFGPSAGEPRPGNPGSLPLGSAADFRARLNTRQIEAELSELFREAPEFGRSLALRLADFLEPAHDGPLRLIGGGGEAAVFGDADGQQVIKLSGPPGPAGFGWILHRTSSGELTLKPGSLAEALDRFRLFESWFPTGLAVEMADRDGHFLLMRQPFIGGFHPTEGELDAWMRAEGWEPVPLPSPSRTLATLTWRRSGHYATDVRPENALCSEADGRLYPIDFIVADLSP